MPAVVEQHTRLGVFRYRVGIPVIRHVLHGSARPGGPGVGIGRVIVDSGAAPARWLMEHDEHAVGSRVGPYAVAAPRLGRYQMAFLTACRSLSRAAIVEQHAGGLRSEDGRGIPSVTVRMHGLARPRRPPGRFGIVVQADLAPVRVVVEVHLHTLRHGVVPCASHEPGFAIDLVPRLVCSGVLRFSVVAEQHAQSMRRIHGNAIPAVAVVRHPFARPGRGAHTIAVHVRERFRPAGAVVIMDRHLAGPAASFGGCGRHRGRHHHEQRKQRA